METIKVWVGRKGSHNGYENSDYKVIQFQGEKLVTWSEDDDERGYTGRDYTVYRSEYGTILIHRVKWSRWADESDYGRLYEYTSLEEAAEDGFRRVLENTGLIPRPVLSLEEWREEKEE